MPVNYRVPDEAWVQDERIRDEELLWRVIPQDLIRPHPTRPGEFIASNQAYRWPELSVFVSSQTTQAQVLSRWPGASMVEISAGLLMKELGLIIVVDPHDIDPDPAHRVVGEPNHSRMPSSKAHTIALRARWVVLQPPQN